jgi:(E)-4-hydroxy-3-methylbut-2-enyl-diphosphate synthase
MQSMCTCPAARTEQARAEIDALAGSGCEIVRVAVKSEADSKALEALAAASAIPLIADIHFDWKLAVASAHTGVAGLRINPGNIGGRERVLRIIEAAAAAGITVRVGVNAGSIERPLRDLYRREPARALCESALAGLAAIEAEGFADLVFSLKSSDPLVTIEANRRFAAQNDYPLHLGVTEAGPYLSGTAKSAAALAILLNEGIGDTIRISLSGDPVREIIAASALLSALGLRDDIPRIVSCPTCGRCWIDVASLAERLERELLGIGKGITVAVMGCEVNGPGEAREADIGIAGTRSGAVIFRKGTVTRTVSENLIGELLAEVRALIDETGTG